MTVTRSMKSECATWTNHWGPERSVKVQRISDGSLGFSIVGGKVEVQSTRDNTRESVSGIFIKHVESNSPTGATGLKTGDRIVEIDGINIRNSSCEDAVEIIKKASSHIELVVQSFVIMETSIDDNQITKSDSDPQRDEEAPKAQEPLEANSEPPNEEPEEEPTDQAASGKSPARDVVKDTEPDVKAAERQDGSDSDSESEEDERYLEGNIRTKAGKEISRKSAGNVRRTAAEIAADPEKEDEFGYTTQKIKKKYHSLGSDVLLFKLERNDRDIGISLAGHADRTQMGVFICGMNPKGLAQKCGDFKVGDEILEVNGIVVQGRSHLNASSIIKKMGIVTLKFVVARNAGWNERLSVKPVEHFPAELEEQDKFAEYEGVRRIALRKGLYGLGIMIVEGKHAEMGAGIFVSDLQEGSVAEQGGLLVGDMILGLNSESMLGYKYDQATNLLKQTEGICTLIVSNPKDRKKNIPEIIEPKADSPKKTGPGGSEATKTPAKTPAVSPARKPADAKEATPAAPPAATAPAPVTGKPTTIEIPFSSDKGPGFIVTGGSDTLSGGIFILDIFPNAPDAIKDQLKCGDQILDAGGESFKSIEQDLARSVILTLTANAKITFLRNENPLETIDVELQRKSGKGIGLSIIGLKTGRGAYISDMLVGGSALESGKLALGDRIISVNNDNVEESSAESIAALMKIATPLSLKVARYVSK